MGVVSGQTAHGEKFIAGIAFEKSVFVNGCYSEERVGISFTWDIWYA